jgi:hypothetical protein
MEIKSVKIRFEKWIHSTPKAHLLQYKNKQLWLSRKVCWDVVVAGNDQHAWAVIPAFIFKEITGNDVNDVYDTIGTSGLRTSFGAVIHKIKA